MCIARPLTDLSRSYKFYCSEKEDMSSPKLKVALTSAPALYQSNANKTFTLYTNASKFAGGVVLEHVRHPVAYMLTCCIDLRTLRCAARLEITSYELLAL